jgi:hypothetical protein
MVCKYVCHVGAETLIEKFRPDMRMLSLGSYSLWETHGPDDERRLEPHEKPLLVQLNWHTEDREGRFLLKCLTAGEVCTHSTIHTFYNDGYSVKPLKSIQIKVCSEQK